MKLAQGNLFTSICANADSERVTELLASPYSRIEHIVSTGQASPPGFWFDQDWDEWVLVVAGSAGLRTGDDILTLRAGDYVAIPAHAKHRVEWSSTTEPTIWLAVHCRPAEPD